MALQLTQTRYSSVYYIRQITDAASVILAFFIGLAAAYWGGASEALKAALLGALYVTVADTALGVVVSLSCPSRKFSSHAFSRVFSKLLVYMCSLLAAYGMDLISLHVLGTNSLMQLIVACMIVFRELGSVLEHSAVLGVPWPEALQRKIDTTRKQMETCLDISEAENGNSCQHKQPDEGVK